MSILTVLTLAATGVGAAGCGDSDDEPKTNTVADPSGTIEVKQGERLALEFVQNPGVGTDWKFLGVRPRGVVELGKTDHESDNPDAVGSNETKRFNFDAEKQGRAALRFERSYRGEVDQTRSVTVVVR